MTIEPEFSLDQPRQINHLVPDRVLAKDNPAIRVIHIRRRELRRKQRARRGLTRGDLEFELPMIIDLLTELPHRNEHALCNTSPSVPSDAATLSNRTPTVSE